MIVGIHGATRSGKNTLATYLASVLQGKGYPSKEIGFADPLKRICKDVFDFSQDQLATDLKDQPDLRYFREGGEPLTPRYALQRLGTEWGRTCHPDIWVKYLHRAAEAAEVEGVVVIVPDLRFANELRFLRERGAQRWSRGTYAIKLTRTDAPGRPLDSHASEKGLPDEGFNLCLQVPWDPYLPEDADAYRSLWEAATRASGGVLDVLRRRG